MSPVKSIRDKRPERFVLTVGDSVARVMPRGTTGRKPANFDRVPPFPPNLFAVVAHMLRLSGAYHHIIMDPGDKSGPERAIAITLAQRNEWILLGKKWRESYGEAPEKVQRLWRSLVRHFDEPVTGMPKDDAWPEWWKIAYGLMAIADEASEDIGYLRFRSKLSWVAKAVPKPSRHDKIPTIATDLVDADIVCVQAKARTPSVGTSLRNISHNLSLLPRRGEMRVHWHAPIRTRPPDDRDKLNLLLVPFPYTIRDDDIYPTSAGLRGIDNTSGWFKVRQSWLRPKPPTIARFVMALLAAARNEISRPINGIVLPELALDASTYSVLEQTLRKKCPEVEFLVAGSSQHVPVRGRTKPAEGNFAAATFFTGPPGNRNTSTLCRGKHHRWALDEHQLRQYDLLKEFAKLGPKKTDRWWECIALGQREILVNTFRRSSAFAVMICEDLARSDPAHEPLRAVGPNLVFVLLMDGPQIRQRWPARYSLGLADDPGSSVLTLTSRALIARANATIKDKEFDQSWSIALWQSGDDKRPAEIKCAPGIDATVISLLAEPTTEATLDGRNNTRTYRWRMDGDPVPITLPDEQNSLRRAVGADPSFHR